MSIKEKAWRPKSFIVIPPTPSLVRITQDDSKVIDFVLVTIVPYIVQSIVSYLVGLVVSFLLELVVMSPAYIIMLRVESITWKIVIKYLLFCGNIMQPIVVEH